ncbi:MAG: ATP-binding protein [Clostridia bacterium]|nr:ATP-binding protein [Clostridia bacterium]
MSENVYEIYENKAHLARKSADRRSAEVWAMDKRIAEIDKELSATGLKLLSAALLDDGKREEAYKRLEADIFALRDEKKKRLIALGLPEDYTDVKYQCEKCSDTGYVGIKMCECMKRALTKQNYKSSGIGKYLEGQTFDNFDLSLYPFGEARENMSRIFNQARSFADSFSPDSSESLFFMGGTGLGKTHLSSAIAKEVIEKGYSVVYDSAQNIISTFERERFARDESVLKSQKYFDAQLLIIDDFGTEIQSKSSISYFYTLINTRLISSKPTIISTNLSGKELNSQYDSRIVSRILGEYTIRQFMGEDIRKLKK